MTIADVFRTLGTQMFWERLSDDHVLDRESGSLIDADEAYLVVRLTEMFLGRSRTLWRKTYPMVHGWASTSDSEEHTVAGPGQLQGLGSGDLERVLVLNSRLAGPTPYTGGDVNLIVGLYSVPGGDTAQALVSTVESFSNLSGVVAHSAVQIMSMVKSSVENILRLSSTSLRLGVSDSFFPDNPLRAGYHGGIGAEAGSIDGTRLWLVNGTLREGPDPMVASPYRKHDYFVVQVERVAVRHDWAALPGIASYSEQFDAVLAEGTGTAAKRERLRLMWPGFDAALRGSVQLTARQAAKIATDVAEDLKRRLEALDQGNPFEDKSSDPDLNGLDATRFELAAVPDHVAPVDAIMPVAPFG